MFDGPKSQQKRNACYNCKEELVFETKIGRRDMCPNCSAYLHSCFNCHHWDANAHNQCRENQGEFIRDRAEGNFCLYFEFRIIDNEATSDADKAKQKLASLFGGGPSKPMAAMPTAATSPEAAARARLDALFKKN